MKNKYRINIDGANEIVILSDRLCDCKCGSYKKHFEKNITEKKYKCIVEDCPLDAIDFLAISFDDSNNPSYSMAVIPVCINHKAAQTIAGFKNEKLCVPIEEGACNTQVRVLHGFEVE